MSQGLETIILKIVNSLREDGKDLHSLQELTKIKNLVEFLKYIEDKDWSTEKSQLIIQIDGYLTENFSSKDLVNIESFFNGDDSEFVKLGILVLYGSILTNPSFRSKLTTQVVLGIDEELRFKYLLENIQKRGRGICKKYLDVLIKQTTDKSLPCGRPTKPFMSFNTSPTVYSNSPKTSMSPLRELFQSPHFKMQKLLNERTKDVKKLQNQIFTLESENADHKDHVDVLQKQREKTDGEYQKLKDQMKTLREQYEDMETNLLSDHKEDQKIVNRLQRDLSKSHKENNSINEELLKVKDDNIEFSTKLQNLQSRMVLTSDERDRLLLENSRLNEICAEDNQIMVSLRTDYSDIKYQLEDLQTYILNTKFCKCQNVEKSFEGNLSLNFGPESPNSKEQSMMSCDGENMATAFVDKILEETRSELEQVRKELDVKIAELSSHQSQAKESIEKLSQEKAQLERDSANLIDSLQKEFSTLKETNQKNVEELTTQINFLNGRLKEGEHQMQMLVANHTEEREGIIACYEDKIMKAEELMKQEIKQLENRLFVSSETIASLEDSKNGMMGAITSLKQCNESQLLTIESLKKEKATLTNDLDKLTLEYDQKVEKLKFELQTSALDKKSKIDSITQSYKEKINEIEKLSKDELIKVEELKVQQIQLLEQKLACSSEINKSLEATNEEMKNCRESQLLSIETLQNEKALACNDLERRTLEYDQNVKKLKSDLQRNASEHKTAIESITRLYNEKLNEAKQLNEEELKIKNEEHQQLREALDNLCKEIDLSQERSKSLLNEKESLVRSYETKSAEFESKITDLNGELKRVISNSEAQLQSAILAHQNDQTKLSDEIASQKEAFNTRELRLQDELELLRKEKLDLQEEIHSCIEENKETKSIFDQLKEDFDKEKKFAKEQIEKASICKSQFSNLSQMLCKLKQEHQEIKKAAEDFLSYIKDLMKKMETINLAVISIKKTHSQELSEVTNNFSRIIDEKNSNNKYLENLVDQKVSTISDLNEELTCRLAEITEFKDLVDQVEEECKENKASVEKLSAENDTLKTSFAEKSIKIVALEKEADSRINENRQAIDRLKSDFEDKLLGLSMQKNKLQDELELRNKKMIDKTSRIYTLETKLDDSSENEKKLQSQNSILNKQVAELQNYYTQMEELKCKHQNEMALSEGKYCSLEKSSLKEKEDLEEILQKTREELHSVKKEKEHERNICLEHTQRISSLHNSLLELRNYYDSQASILRGELLAYRDYMEHVVNTSKLHLQDVSKCVKERENELITKEEKVMQLQNSLKESSEQSQVSISNLTASHSEYLESKITEINRLEFKLDDERKQNSKLRESNEKDCELIEKLQRENQLKEKQIESMLNSQHEEKATSQVLLEMKDLLKLESEKKEIQEAKIKELESSSSLFKEQENQWKKAQKHLQSKITKYMQELQEEKEKAKTIEARLIDKDKDLSLAKEDVMRVEREEGKTIISLKQELEAQKNKASLDRQKLVEKMKTSYKTEIENIMEQLDKHQNVEKTMEQKYQAAKLKITELSQEKNECRSSNAKAYEMIKKCEDRIKHLTANVNKEETINEEYKCRLTKLEEERQPLKDRVLGLENEKKRLFSINSSLEAQIKMADASIRDLKRQQQRQSITTQSMRDLPSLIEKSSQSSMSDSPDNDSQTLLIPNEKVKRFLPKRNKLPEPKVSEAKPVFRRPATSSSYLKETKASLLRQSASASNVNTLNIQTLDAPPRVLRSFSQVKTQSANPPHNILKAKSDQNLLDRSVPKVMAPLFTCEDEEDMHFNNDKYLADFQQGPPTNLDASHDWRRVSELQRRNSLYPPHMRSSYHPELQYQSNDLPEDKMRDGSFNNDKLLELTVATDSLDLNSPAYNLRKRKSLSDSLASDSSITSSGKKSRRLSTSYCKPGPPTPGRRNLRNSDKENSDLNISIGSTSSTSSKRSKTSAASFQTPMSSYATPSGKKCASPSTIALRSGKGSSPANKKWRTPSKILKSIGKGKSPWRKLNNESQSPKHINKKKFHSKFWKNTKPLK